MGTYDPDTNTDSVVVSDGDDKKISLWRKTGQSTGTIPAVGTDSGGDNIETLTFNHLSTLQNGSLALDVATRPQNAEGYLQRHRPLMICDAKNQYGIK
ncbi:hypothetical protein Tco_1134252 [Tanacetum coccineum]